jgi:hypothetical protein
MCGARPSRQASICARRRRVSAVENTIGFLFCIFSLRTTLFSAAGMLPGRWFEAVRTTMTPAVPGVPSPVGL